MKLSIKSNPTMPMVNATVGGAVLTLIAGALWALLYGFGWLVTQATIWLGGSPGMWSIGSLFGAAGDPSYLGVSLGFLYCLLALFVLSSLALVLLASLGNSVLGKLLARARA